MLELKSVDAGYGTFQALFGVSLEINAGEAVGVIGPNGAGKTTLMRVISGLIRPRSGTISMEGVDILKTPEHRIVSRWNGRGIWKVRPMPRLMIRCGARPEISCPSNCIEPADGGKVPESMLKMVPLPEPFGPIRPSISP